MRWVSKARAASATCSTRASSAGTRWVTGADVAGSHVIDLVAGRDFEGDGTIEAAEVRDGDPCPRCGSPLETARGIEMGHIFQLGRDSPTRWGCRCSTRTASSSPSPWARTASGSRGRSPPSSRTRHDELGIIWPREVSPADVHLVATGKDPAIFEAAERLVADLEAAGLDGPVRRPARRSRPA